MGTWNPGPGPTSGDDVFVAAHSGDTADGGGGNDLMLAGFAGSTLYGGLGNDTLIGQHEPILDGGAGDDFYVIRELSDVLIIEAASGGHDTVHLESAFFDTNATDLSVLVDMSGFANLEDFAVVPNNVAPNSTSTGRITLIANGGNNTISVGVENFSSSVATFVSSDQYHVFTVYAGDGDDTIQHLHYDTASIRDIVFYGEGGNDHLIGGYGVDYLDGGDGNDTLQGVSGVDTLVGGLGDDTYLSGNGAIISDSGGHDTILTLDSNHTLHASLEDITYIATGNFSAVGNSLDNVITGGSRNDTLNGAAGADTLIGGLGNDVYVVDSIQDVIHDTAGASAETVQTSLSAYSLAGNSAGWDSETTWLALIENLTFVGTGDFAGFGNNAVNVIRGGAGADTLDGGAGDDELYGGAGNDIYYVDSIDDWVFDSQGTDTLIYSGTNYDISGLPWIEILQSRGLLIGNFLYNRLVGSNGADTLNGAAGNDTLDGGAGADILIGDVGDDVYFIDDSGDVASETSSAHGDDQVQSSVTYTLGAHLERLTLTGVANINGVGNSLDNTITGNSGNNLLNGGAGADTLTGGDGNDAYYIDNASDVIVEAANEGTDSVFASVAWVLGADVENLTLTGGAAISGVGNTQNNSITGNAGANLIDGGLGADTMAGGGGNDIYFADDAGDVVMENTGGGADVVRASVTHTLSANVENLLMLGSAGIWGNGNDLANVIIGNSGANRIWTGAGQDFLDGGGGADTMIGGAGNDVYYIDQAGDVVQEDANAGIDTVRSYVSHVLGASFENMLLVGSANSAGGGNGLNNLILGGVGNNKIWGSTGNDTLSGGAGNDTLHGGAGLDFLTGGADADAFVFDTAPVASQADRISDFSVADDTIWLENAIFTKFAAAGALNAAFFRVGAAAADANDYIIYNSANGALYYDNDGNGAGGATLIAMIGTGLVMTGADFLVI